MEKKSAAVHQNYSIKTLFLLLFVTLFTASTADQKRVLFEEYSFSGTSLDISGETANARAHFWRPDGSAIYVTGRDTENVAAYTVVEPWNLGSATFMAELDISNEMNSMTGLSVAHGLYLRDDGEKMWVFNRTEIWGYTLAAPWDITSATQTYHKDLSEFVQRGHDFDFKPDGIRLYIDDRNAQAVYEVHLAIPWDITTIEWVYTLDISDQENAVRGLEMIEDGSIMLLMDTGRSEVLQYELSVPYDLKTARYVNAFDVSAQTSNPRGLSIRPDFEFFYVTGTDNQKIYQYSRNRE
jgi:hypothetical protein